MVIFPWRKKIIYLIYINQFLKLTNFKYDLIKSTLIALHQNYNKITIKFHQLIRMSNIQIYKTQQRSQQQQNLEPIYGQINGIFIKNFIKRNITDQEIMQSLSERQQMIEFMRESRQFMRTTSQSLRTTSQQIRNLTQFRTTTENTLNANTNAINANTNAINANTNNLNGIVIRLQPLDGLVVDVRDLKEKNQNAQNAAKNRKVISIVIIVLAIIATIIMALQLSKQSINKAQNIYVKAGQSEFVQNCKTNVENCVQLQSAKEQKDKRFEWALIGISSFGVIIQMIYELFL